MSRILIIEDEAAIRRVLVKILTEENKGYEVFEAEDGLRLERYIRRERKQEKPNFDEICRRFLSDQKDFAEEKIAEAGIERRFDNSGELQDCINEVYAYVKEMLLQS